MKLRMTFRILLVAIMLIIVQNIYAQKKSKRNKNSISKSVEKDAEKHFTEGTKYFILEDFAKSYVLYQKALDIEPNNAAIHYKIAELHSKGDDFSKALFHANKAVELDKDNKFYYLLSAKIYSAQSNFKAASETYENMISTIPGTEEYLFDLAAIYIFQKDLDSAIETYEKAEIKYGKLEEIVYQKQLIYLQQNKLDLAIHEGEELIKNNPGKANYVLRLADILKNNERSEEAILLLNKLMLDSPELARAQLMLYEIYSANGNENQAREQLLGAFGSPEIDANAKLQVMVGYIEQLPSESLQSFVFNLADKLIDTHPENPNVYAIYGDIYFRLGDKQNALNKYLQTITLDKSNFSVWQNIIQLEAELFRMDSVAKHSSEALEYFPNQSMLYYYNGTANLTSKNHEVAIQAFQQGKKLTGNNQALLNAMNAQLGDAYNAIQDHEKSDLAYEAVLKYDPDNDHVLNNYSYFLSLRQEKLELAKMMSTKLAKRNPDNPTFLDTHAWVLFVNGDYDQALIFMERAIAKSANPSGTLYEHYGDILFKVDQVDKAVEQWKKAKGMDVTSDLIDKKITDRKLYEQ